MSEAERQIALFDQSAWRFHRDRAARSGSVDFLHFEVAERLFDRLDLIDPQTAHQGGAKKFVAAQQRLHSVCSSPTVPATELR